VAGIDLSAFWQMAVDGTAELDYSEALAAFGLGFKAPPVASSNRPSKPWLGISTRVDNGRLVIVQVERDSPADVAGLGVDDEILAFDDFRVRADRLENRLEQYQVGDIVSVLVARREQLQRVQVTFGSAPSKSWRLEPIPSATDTQRQLLDGWLRG